MPSRPSLRRSRARGWTASLLVACTGLALAASGQAAQASTNFTCAADSGKSVRVLHAGSLTNLVSLSLTPAFEKNCGADVTNLGGPAVGIANSIKDGSATGSVYMSADANVNRQLMGKKNGDWVRWYLTFARNAEVINYTPESKFFADLEQARLGKVPWYEVVSQPGFVLGRTDPNTDPGGYYAVMVAQLAQRHYKIPGLKKKVLGSTMNPDQVLAAPEFTKTVSGKTPDANFGYVSSAKDKKLHYIALPKQINLSAPKYATFYNKVSFTNAKGVTLRGAPIYDSVTVLQRSKYRRAAIDFVRFLLSPRGHELVLSRGFLPGKVLLGGDRGAVPKDLRRFIDGCHGAGRCAR